LKNKETKFSELKNQVKQLQQEMLQKIESHGGELANAHAQARDAANRLLLMTDQLRELVKNSLQTQTVFAGFLKEFSEVSEFGKRLEQKIESRIDESKAQTIAYEITQTKIINGINYLKEEMQKIPASKKLRNMHDRRRRMA
jgi:hypothetical protein